MLFKIIKWIGSAGLLSFSSNLLAQGAPGGQVALPGLAINFGQGVNLVDTIEVLTLFTVLSLAPAILIMCTSFTRMIVVLSFLRQAIGTQNLPPNQLLVGLALFLTMFVMKPTGMQIYDRAIRPYMDKQVTTTVALQEVETALK